MRIQGESQSKGSHSLGETDKEESVQGKLQSKCSHSPWDWESQCKGEHLSMGTHYPWEHGYATGKKFKAILCVKINYTVYQYIILLTVQ